MIRPVATASAADPRQALDPQQRLALATRAMPLVARPRRASDGIGLTLGVLGALGLGALTLLGLSGQRSREAVPAPAAVVEPVPPAVDIAPPPPAIKAAQAPPPAPADPNQVDPGQSRAMPLIFDSTDGDAATTAAADPAAAGAAGAGRDGLSDDELFAVRMAGEEPPLVQARALGDRRLTIVQGSILPAVLETAVNSDLPGYARAIVSGDVHGFDGSTVLVPRGSRLVGQYKSGLAAGQSRAYIMWTRLIRPDGVSVQLGSPVMDEGGEIGLPGEVKRHFWQRFGSSILLSVVSGLAGSMGDGNSVVIAGSGAQGAAGVALETDGKIPPTIRIPLGTPIQVFVARDLDFSGLAAPAAVAAAPAQEVAR